MARAIQDEVAAGLRPGAVPSRLFALARERADAAGLGDRFMGPPGAQARFVGHGIGLELDEVPVLAPGFDAPLQLGMTLRRRAEVRLPRPGGGRHREHLRGGRAAAASGSATLPDDLLVAG